MVEKIEDVVKEKAFEDTVLQIVRSKHHHEDGSTVVLTPSENEASDIERKIIEDENEWKLRQVGTDKNNVESRTDAKSQIMNKPESQEDFTVVEKKEKTIVASCNCGEIFASTFSNDKSPTNSKVKIKTYDASGTVKGMYSISGSEQPNYAASGNGSETYS